MTTDDTGLGGALAHQVILSIITVTLNNADGLRKTLDSVAYFLDDPSVEVIVVDGNSVDDTLEVVESFRRERLTFLSEPDEGVYDAMNKGAQLSRGAYLMWLNSGDTLARDDALVTILHSYGRNHCGVSSGQFICKAARAARSESAICRTCGGVTPSAFNRIAIKLVYFRAAYTSCWEVTRSPMAYSETSTSSSARGWCLPLRNCPKCSCAMKAAAEASNTRTGSL